MKTVLKKMITFFITVLLVTLFVFLAFELIPGDAATARLGTNATPEALSALREELGLNRPFFVRYFSWLGSFFFGDMGISTSYRVTVRSMLSSKLPITMTLTLMSFIMVIAISIPAGVITSKYEDRVGSKICDVTGQLAMSIPPFFLGIIVTYVFGMVLSMFTPGGYVSYETDPLRFLGYMFFPALAIAVPKAAMSTKLLKTSILSERRLDYVRTAYSRGNSTTDVLYKHVLKNALIPVITFLGMTLADIVAGSLVIEQVFSIPGYGRLLISSIANRDYPVVQSIITIIAMIVILINLLVDILYQVLDPRLREGRS
ncbi:MAG: ABC transporter permease [Lachnospiraceae bacterium]|nr:ABC transporter permease [Lachnospiraceae bacterium]